MELGLQGAGSTVGSHLKNKEEYWPSQGKTKADFSPVDPSPLWAAACRPPVLH